MKIRVFELARSKNMTISEAVDLLSKKGIQNATAVTYVESAEFDDVPPKDAQGPDSQAVAERSASIARNILSRPQEQRGWAGEERFSGENQIGYVALGISSVALVIAAFLFFSERSDRSEMNGLRSEISILKAGNSKMEDVIVSNRAQIMETREQVVAVEKRFYEFKRASVMAQLKSQGVVLKALSENMREPLKSKTQALANGLATF